MPEEDKVEIEKRIAAGELESFVDDRFELFIGDQNDVLDRYYKCARKFGIDTIVRITADCPMHQATSGLIDEMIAEYIKRGSNGFMGNNLLVSKVPYPCGVDVEIFSYPMLCWAKKHAQTDYNKEHVVPLFYSDLTPFPIYSFDNLRPHTQITTKVPDFSLDTPEDLEYLQRLTAKYDECKDPNKALENTEPKHNKTNMSKNFRQ